MSKHSGLYVDECGVSRCWWCASDPMYVAYHDREWGFPVFDDTRLFEKICLEGFQSGLSWLTILKKRENFRRAFAGFAMAEVAAFTRRDVNRLLADAGIVRHRGKIESTINNARRALEVIDEFGSLANFIWRHAPADQARPKRLDWKTLSARSTTPSAAALSKELKRRGWSFVGPTTIYSFMQAMGLVNDHITGCVVREAAEAAFGRSAKRRKAFGRI